MGSSSVWGDVRSFAVMEYDWSCDSGIFQSWWLKVMSPYSNMLTSNHATTRTGSAESDNNGGAGSMFFFFSFLLFDCFVFFSTQIVLFRY